MVLIKHSTHKSDKLNTAVKGDSSQLLIATMLTLLRIHFATLFGRKENQHTGKNLSLSTTSI